MCEKTSKRQAYHDTVEIVKAAVGARESGLAGDASRNVTAEYIQSVYDKLCHIAADAFDEVPV